jgi:hypothetical protein
MPAPQQCQLVSTHLALSPYFVTYLDFNAVGRVGCKHLSKGQWPQLKIANLCTEARIQPLTASRKRAARGYLRPAGRDNPEST